MTTDPKQPEAQEAPASERELPDLPAASASVIHYVKYVFGYEPLGRFYRDAPFGSPIDLYTAEQMQAYARAALGKQPTQEAPPRTTEKDVELIERMQKSIVDLHREIAEIDKEYGLSTDAPDVWKKAVDDELALCESTVSSFPDARAAVRGLIDWHVRKQEAPADAKDAALKLAREYVEAASQRGYDGTQGYLMRQEAKRRLALIDSALQSHQEGGKP